jgi:hypothetical protein
MRYICTTNSNSVYAQGTVYHPGDEADLSAKYVDGKKDKAGKVIIADKKKHWTLKADWVKKQEEAEEARLEAEYAAKNAPEALAEANARIAELEAAAAGKEGSVAPKPESLPEAPAADKPTWDEVKAQAKLDGFTGTASKVAIAKFYEDKKED